ncbi:myb-like protein J [Vigna umbellata]|uniref:myb-like protein J n=1 Tax=Vigna umbellata TaxID=87088 RepID=UPI001F5EE417|nr:myb-like protein J [Vigna umbellata]
MTEQSDECQNEFRASPSKLLPIIQTQSSPSHNFNDMSETTSPLSCPVQDVVESLPMSSSSQTSQRDNMRVQSKKSKRITWTTEEHRRFLEALSKYEKGNWKQISAYIQTKNVTQVASHAQKYFIRQGRSEEQKKRKSIHDMVLDTNIDNENSSSSKTNPAISQFYEIQPLQIQPQQSIPPTQYNQRQPPQVQPLQRQPLQSVHHTQFNQRQTPQVQPLQSVHHTQFNKIRRTHSVMEANSFNKKAHHPTQFAKMQPVHPMASVNSNNIVHQPAQFNPPTTNVFLQVNPVNTIIHHPSQFNQMQPTRETVYTNVKNWSRG